MIMNQLQVTLVLDKDMLQKVDNYHIYRSQEEESGRPVIDSLYIQRRTIYNNPPKN